MRSDVITEEEGAAGHGEAGGAGHGYWWREGGRYILVFVKLDHLVVI